MAVVGRPKMSEDVRRTKKLTVRINHSEQMMLEDISRRLGVSESRFIRALIKLTHDKMEGDSK